MNENTKQAKQLIEKYVSLSTGDFKAQKLDEIADNLEAAGLEPGMIQTYKDKAAIYAPQRLCYLTIYEYESGEISVEIQPNDNVRNLAGGLLKEIAHISKILIEQGLL